METSTRIEEHATLKSKARLKSFAAWPPTPTKQHAKRWFQSTLTCPRGIIHLMGGPILDPLAHKGLSK